MNAKQFAQAKTIPALRRFLENLEADAPALIIDDMTILFLDSFYKLHLGDRKGLKYVQENPDYPRIYREDSNEGTKLVAEFVSKLLNADRENIQLKKEIERLKMILNTCSAV